MKNFVLAFFTSRFLQRVPLPASVGFVSAGFVYESAMPACSAGSAGETILPVKHSVQAYYVFDFGWSDSWFFSNSGAYDGNKDVLSGDDSPFILKTAVDWRQFGQRLAYQADARKTVVTRLVRCGAVAFRYRSLTRAAR